MPIGKTIVSVGLTAILAAAFGGCDHGAIIGVAGVTDSTAAGDFGGNATGNSPFDDAVDFCRATDAAVFQSVDTLIDLALAFAHNDVPYDFAFTTLCALSSPSRCGPLTYDGFCISGVLDAAYFPPR